MRAGSLELAEVLGHIDRVTAELESVTSDVALPEKPAIDEVDAYVARAYRTTWDAWDA